MRIAILGATSMLAADFVSLSHERGWRYDFTLFARQREHIRDALLRRGMTHLPECRSLSEFSSGNWDAIVNFIGIGDPARAAAMGADILRLTQMWDARVLDCLDANPACRYIFMSSGSAFGAAASGTIDAATQACFDINALAPSALYGIAKFYCETVHRSRHERSIIDIRIFNYLSKFADLDHRFLINEIIAAVRDNQTIRIAPGNIWRDYLGREDFGQLMKACLAAPAGYNGAIDAYSVAPTSKADMLELFRNSFGLKFEMTGEALDATGLKSRYYSLNRVAEALGYTPQSSSIDTLDQVARAILASA